MRTATMDTMKVEKSPGKKAVSRREKVPAVVAPPLLKKFEIADIGADHDLERAIPYLIARAGMRMGQSFSRELKQFDLTLTEWRVCVSLHHKSQQRLSELASHTSTEASTLSRTVEGLLQRGLLVRGRSDEDGRALALSLTGEGWSLTERIIPLAQLYERVALSGMKPGEAEQLRNLLLRLYDNMEALGDGA